MKRLEWSRLLVVSALAAVSLVSAGDSVLGQAVTTDIGIDPLAILDLQIKPNVLIVLDTSGSMRDPVDTNYTTYPDGQPIGGDDPQAKLYQAKLALSQVLTANAANFNFGFASYGLLNSDKVLDDGWSRTTYNGVDMGGAPLTYVSAPDAGVVTGSTATNVAAIASASGRFLRQAAWPAGCTGAACRYYAYSQVLYANRLYRYTTTGTFVSGPTVDTTCPAPPSTLFPNDGLGYTGARPCFKIEIGTVRNGNFTRTDWAYFYYTSGSWREPNTGNRSSTSPGSCTPAAPLQSVAACAADNSAAIRSSYLKLEMPLAGCEATGVPCRLNNWINVSPGPQATNPATVQGVNANAVYGVLAAQATPLAGVLADVRNRFATYFPNQVAGQRNIVLLVTDGDESCGGVPAQEAAANYARNPRIETLVIGFGLNTVTLNRIARAGSGGVYANGTVTGGTLDAFTAVSLQDLIAKLNLALEQTQSAAEFSDTQTVTESVFEYGGTAPTPVDPRDPDVRYNTTVPLLMQSTFEMPGFVGHLNAFRNNNGSSLQVWDAGDKLCRLVTGYGASSTAPAVCNVTGVAPDTVTMGNQQWTFAELVGTNGGAPGYLNSTGRLRRRIFTTTRNGVFPYNYSALDVSGTSQKPSEAGPVVPLWPPIALVDPVLRTGSYPAGSLDTALGISGLSVPTLQSTFGACLTTAGDTPNPECAKTGFAAKEARQMILAYNAGAQAVRDGSGKPRRDTTGAIKYVARSWFLGDGTLSGPAMSPPPLQAKSGFATAEYELYRDGPHQSSGTPMAPASQMALGFGQRNPDLDSNAASKTTSKNTMSLKPVMSVVYYGANDMLHAFRAGPRIDATCTMTGSGNTGFSCPTTYDTGGEELWGFVPFDQLGKLQQIMLQGQSRANHKYVIATGLRLADIFVPGSYRDPTNTSRTGHWRRLLFFGRGIGGKHYTALDVTAPGVFTQSAATANPPLVLWNRGNPDIQDAGGLANTLTNTGRVLLVNQVPTTSRSSDDGVADAAAYATMGQTWSVPAVARVEPTTNLNRNSLLLTGSGYRPAGGSAGEGRSFYSIDPLTGDILTRVDVGSDSSSVIADNAIVANPAVFNKAQVSYNVGNPMANVADRVYVGDLHGRLWKFPLGYPAGAPGPGTAVQLWSFGAGQPIANGVALLNYDGGTGEKPHIYVETGNDRRVSTGPFKLAGLEDNGTGADTTAGNATLLFSFDLTDRFKGTVQPATAFGGGGNARVFMVGTRFNPLNGGNCQTSFDSIFYAVSAQTGSAVYDLNGNGIDASDVSTIRTNTRVNAVSVSGGTLMIDQGLQAQNAPPPPAPPESLQSNSARRVFVQSVNAGGTVVCR